MSEIKGKNEKLEKKLSMAKERNSRVVFVNSPFTHKVLDVLQQSDRAYSRARARMGMPGGLTFDEAIALLNDYHEAAIKLAEASEKLCKASGISFRMPRGMNDKS